MKRLILFCFCVLFYTVSSAQVSKTVHVTTAGTFNSFITDTESTTITNLTVSGNIDVRDVLSIRAIRWLHVLDISDVVINEYTGTGGTISGSQYYPANEMPSGSFYIYDDMTGWSTSKLQTIILPNTITTIGSGAFNHCSYLGGSLTIPNSVTSIGSSAFVGGNGFQGKLTLSNSLVSIGDDAFNYCHFTDELTLPNSLVSIGNNAFYGCHFTGELTLSNSLTSIGENAFKGCSFTGKLTIPNSVTYIGSSVFAGFTGFKGELTLSNSLKTIGLSAFAGCTGFTGKLTIPNSVTYIGISAFTGCTGFTGELTLSNSLTTIGQNAFTGCTGFTGELTIPNSVTSIGSSAFAGCTGFTGELTIPNSVTSIGSSAFPAYKIVNCLNTIPPNGNGLTSIPEIVYVPESSVLAYKASASWKDFTIIGAKMVTIDIPTAGNLAAEIISKGLGPLSSISHLYVNGNLNKLDILQMKSNMTSLTNIDMSGASIIDNALPANAFQDKKTLKHIVLPSSLVSIGDYAFSGCTILSGSLILPSALISIGKYAFSNLSGFTGTLIIPNSVNSIGDYAFSGCTGFTGSLKIPNSVTSLGNFAFSGCSGFTGSLIIPTSVTTIASSVFRDCSKFTELSINENITNIGSQAFMNCSGLTKITTLCSIPPIIEENTFEGINKETCKLEVPIGSITSYQTAYYWNLFIYTGTSGVTDLINSQAKVYTTPTDIIIDGTSVGEKVSLYYVNGLQIENLQSQGKRITIPIDRSGIYLVKVNRKTFKVIFMSQSK